MLIQGGLMINMDRIDNQSTTVDPLHVNHQSAPPGLTIGNQSPLHAHCEWLTVDPLHVDQ